MIYTGINQHRYGNWWVSVENISKHGGFSLFVNSPTRIISGTWWICFMSHKHVNLSNLPFSSIFYLVHGGFVSSHGEIITSSGLLLKFPRLFFERIQPNPLKMDVYLVVAFTYVIWLFSNLPGMLKPAIGTPMFYHHSCPCKSPQLGLATHFWQCYIQYIYNIMYI